MQRAVEASTSADGQGSEGPGLTPEGSGKPSTLCPSPLPVAHRGEDMTLSSSLWGGCPWALPCPWVAAFPLAWGLDLDFLIRHHSRGDNSNKKVLSSYCVLATILALDLSPPWVPQVASSQTGHPYLPKHPSLHSDPLPPYSPGACLVIPPRQAAPAPPTPYCYSPLMFKDLIIRVSTIWKKDHNPKKRDM